jgi:hypothetical protein
MSVLALALGAATAHAGKNPGVTASLSWSATSQVSDTNPSATNNLYVRFTAAPGETLSFKGAEIDLRWDPPGDGAGCRDHIGTVYKTSSGTTCTYLNRGSVVPVVTADDPDHLHVAWASNSSLTTCSAGAVIQIQFETDACVDAGTKFILCGAIILDENNQIDVITGLGSPVTISGGGTGNPACNSAPVLSGVPATITVVSGDSVYFNADATDADGDVVTYSVLQALPQGATFNGATGEFMWRTADDNSQVGTDTLTVVASDGKGGMDEATVLILVQKLNHPPVIASVRDTTVSEGALLDIPLSATDPDGDLVSFSIQADYPPGSTIVNVMGQAHFQWTPDFSSAGTYPNVTIVASDGVAQSSTSFTITVRDSVPSENLPPMIAPLDSQSVYEDSVLTIQATATDPEGDYPIHWFAVDLPAGARIDSLTGVLTWRPDFTAGEINGGSYRLAIGARDSRGAADTGYVSVTVIDQPPDVEDTTTVHFCTQQSRSYTLTAEDDDGGAITWAATGLPAWLTLDSTGVLTGQAPPSDFGTTFYATATAIDAQSGQGASSQLVIIVDCTPASALAAHAPTAPLNRHTAGEEPYWISFDLIGVPHADRLAPADVSLAWNGEEIGAMSVRITDNTVAAGFAARDLARLLAGVRSGEEAPVTLRVRTEIGEVVGQVVVSVMGVSGDASLVAHPNPFRGATDIEYVVPEHAHVTVAVYNADGRRVRTFADGGTEAGTYRVRWDGRTDAGARAPRGIYYVRGTVGATHLATRITLLR